MKSPNLQSITNAKPFQITVRPLAQRCAARTSAARQLTRNVVEHIHPRAEEPCSSSRREVLQYIPAAGCTALISLVTQQRAAQAVQGLTAGRIPGLSGPDANGYRTYTRPEGKSGGHGVGWSEIPRYSFKVPQGWQETAVSIADLGGTEIDLRFTSQDQGSLAVVVAPVLRFIDVGFNADVRIEEIGPPEKLISGFAPELFGSPLAEDDVMNTVTEKKGPLTFYRWELKPHRLVEATAYKNRMFLMAISANGRQWRKGQEQLRHIQQSFNIVEG